MQLIKKIIKLGKGTKRGDPMQKANYCGPMDSMTSNSASMSGSSLSSIDTNASEISSVRRTSTTKLQRRSENAEKIAMVNASFTLMNAHALDADAGQGLHTEDAVWYFHDEQGSLVHEMRWADFMAEMQKVFASFPDFAFTYYSVKAGKKSTVVLSNGVASGTHTGAPYGFGPYEAIEATGKFFQNDPENIKISFREGKICRYDVYVRGRMTGLAGVYTQLGGFPLL